MLAQDPVTGQLYEVPDNQPYGIGYEEAPTMMLTGSEIQSVLRSWPRFSRR